MAHIYFKVGGDFNSKTCKTWQGITSDTGFCDCFKHLSGEFWINSYEIVRLSECIQKKLSEKFLGYHLIDVRPILYYYFQFQP